MHPLKTLLSLAILVVAALASRGAEAAADGGQAAGAAVAHAADAAHAEHQGLPSAAPRLREGGLVTSSMMVTWIVAGLLIWFARSSMKNAKAVPDGKQNFWEWMVENLYEFLEGIIGRDLVKKTYWFFATIFIFILFTNWAGLFPGVGTIGWGTPTSPGSSNLAHVETPLFRGGNADLNMTFAMAAIFMVLWFIWALRSNGIWGFALHLFGPKGDSTGFIKYMMIVIFFCVGFLEVISIAFRPISLSFRLYGNIFAGENLLEAMSNAVQSPAWAKAVFSVVLPVPFYFLEVLVGLVQAFVFMLLTTVFTALICEHDEEHAKGHH